MPATRNRSAIPSSSPQKGRQPTIDNARAARYRICITIQAINAIAITTTMTMVMTLLRVELELTVS